MCMHIAILGCGIEGRSIAAYFRKMEGGVTVCDVKRDIDKSAPEFSGVHFQTGPNYLQNLSKFDLVFRSPGISYKKKELQKLGPKLTSLTKYFFEHCPCHIIGITGTKGKGTTATLLYQMLKAETPTARGGTQKKAPLDFARGEIFIGGNIGTSPLDFLDALKPGDTVILELSSFQLQDLKQSPHIAIILGITPDHLDYHENLDEYIEAKRNIVRHQKAGDTAIIDIDNAESAAFGQGASANIREISTQKSVAEGGCVKVASLVITSGKTATIIGEKGQTGIIGEHNLKNILAASVAASELGVSVEIISKVIREFKGLPHRLEFIGEFGGARYYNDSLSTTPETAIAALRTFTSPLILIAGGSDKNVAYSALGEEIVERLNVKTVVLMGQTKGKIERAIDEAALRQKTREHELQAKGRPVRVREIPLEVITAENYQEAFMVARMLAQPGDTVLLSPASASFDMFANYQERGEIFSRFVTSTS